MGQFQPSKVLFAAFVPRKSLDNDEGRRGISHLLMGNNHVPVMVARAGQAALPTRLRSMWAALFQRSVIEVVVFCALCCLTLKLPLL